MDAPCHRSRNSWRMRALFWRLLLFWQTSTKEPIPPSISISHAFRCTAPLCSYYARIIHLLLFSPQTPCRLFPGEPGMNEFELFDLLLTSPPPRGWRCRSLGDMNEEDRVGEEESRPITSLLLLPFALHPPVSPPFSPSGLLSLIRCLCCVSRGRVERAQARETKIYKNQVHPMRGILHHPKSLPCLLPARAAHSPPGEGHCHAMTPAPTLATDRGI